MAPRLERYADKPNSGGMCFDAASSISAIDRSYSRVITREDLFWPDGIMPGPDGAIYVVVTQLPRSPVLSPGGGDEAMRPFKVFRFKP